MPANSKIGVTVRNVAGGENPIEPLFFGGGFGFVLPPKGGIYRAGDGGEGGKRDGGGVAAIQAGD